MPKKVNIISPRVEEIFSQAVALEQSGRMKNTVFATGDTIYILSFDQTILLRFKLRKSEAVFDQFEKIEGLEGPILFWNIGRVA